MNQATIEKPDGSSPPRPPIIRSEPPGPGVIEEVFAVGNRRIVVRFPETISSEEFQDVKDWLPILERKIKRCVKEGE